MSTEARLFESGRLQRSGRDAPADLLTLMPFLNLAREVSALFVPLRMRPDFRESLEDSLLLAARTTEKAAGYGGLAGSQWESRFDEVHLDRRWVVGAAVGSAVSIAGIAVIVWRYRGKAA